MSTEAKTFWVMLGIIVACILLAHLNIKIQQVVKNRGRSRTLVATKSVYISVSKGNRPVGLCHVIDEVKLRAGDYVVLTCQDLPESNGWWLVRKGAWVRPGFIRFTNGAGAWVVPTAGSQSGTFWLHEADQNRWNSITVHQNVRLISFENSNIAPSDPLEAAAFLLRLGINNPDRIRGLRVNCIDDLADARLITEVQRSLLLAKPENLTTHVTLPDGSRVVLTDQTWTEQVRGYMASLQSTYSRFVVSQEIRDGFHDEARLVTPFSTRVLSGFERIPKEKSVEEPPAPEEPLKRRSRYEREPVI